MSFFEVYQSCSLFGALRYFANIKDTISLINGPLGCAFYARNAVINLNGYFESLNKVDIPKIFNLNFSESDVIFGNTDKVKKAIYEIKEKYHPKVIFVFNCCVSEIVGSDIDEIAEDFADVMVIPIHTAGFKGDHKYGMKLASQIICDCLMPRNRITPSGISVNILGEFDFFNRSTQELTTKLQVLGITNIRHIPGKATLKDIEDATSATLNIITCQNASKYMAEIMKIRYGIPFVGEKLSLYGIQNTYDFYKDIFSFFGADIATLEVEMSDAWAHIQQYQRVIRNKKAAIIAGTRRALGYASILRELGLEIVLLFSETEQNCNTEDDFRVYSNNLFIDSYIDDLQLELERSNPDVIFTTLPEMVAPNSYLPRLSDDFAGFSGAVRMAEYLYQYFSNAVSLTPILIYE